MKIDSDAREHERRSELEDSTGEAQAWSRHLLEPTSDPLWRLLAAPYTPALEGQVEAELALGNGRFGMRAVLPFATPGAQPRVYVAGLFGQPPGPVLTPVLFTAPIWLYLYLTIDGEAVSPEAGGLRPGETAAGLPRGVLVVAINLGSPPGHPLAPPTTRVGAAGGTGAAHR